VVGNKKLIENSTIDGNKLNGCRTRQSSPQTATPQDSRRGLLGSWPEPKLLKGLKADSPKIKKGCFRE